MNNLSLVKSERFGEIEADIYSNGDDMFMTINQLAACLEYADKSGVEKIVQRNPYLKEAKFSGTDVLSVPNKNGFSEQETRVFTEDGIYEVTMLSKQPKAREFREFIRGILKALRTGKAKLVSMTAYQRMMAETRAENVRIRKAQLLERLAKQYDGSYKQVLQAHATKELTGEFLIPLPELKAKTYSATDLAKMFDITPNMVGVLSNRHGLKTDEYGEWFKDKAKHSNKEVPTFRYFDTVIPVLRSIIKGSSDIA